MSHKSQQEKEGGRKMVLKNIVAFCILMENNGGIIDKSPDYILEKFNRYVISEREDESNWGLDVFNQEKLSNWQGKWLGKETDNGIQK